MNKNWSVYHPEVGLTTSRFSIPADRQATKLRGGDHAAFVKRAERAMRLARRVTA